MNLSGLLPLVRHVPAYQELLAEIRLRPPGTALAAPSAGSSPAGLGVIAAARPYLLAALYRELARPMILIVARAEQVGQWVDQLRVWTQSPGIYAFPEPDALPYERVPWSRETISDRLSAFAALVRWGRPQPRTDPEGGALPEAPVVVASARALMHKTLPLREFRLGLREVRCHQEIDLQRTLDLWVANGYRPETVVEEPGTFSRRGGLIDVFPPNLNEPVRIELFGDEVDSLRVFDATTQRSERLIEEFLVAPATECLPRLGPPAAGRLAGLDLRLCHPPAAMEYKADLVALEQAAYFRGIEFYLPFFYTHPATLLDYLPDEGVLAVDDWQALAATVLDLDRQAKALEADLVKAGELPVNLSTLATPHFDWSYLEGELLARAPVVLADSRSAQGRGAESGSDVLSPPMPPRFNTVFTHGESYGGQLKRVLDGCQGMREAGDGQRVVLISRQAQRISELLADRMVAAEPREAVLDLPPPRSLTLVQGTLAGGWSLSTELNGPEAGLSLLTDTEIFGWARPAPRKASRPRPMAPEAFFADVEPGSYVVHVEHGIGLFQGLAKMSFNGGEREYLLVEYAAGDKLYVPVYQADRLSRYVGVSDHPPQVNRLGSADWERVKEQTKKAVAEIADDLLALYAAREVVEGHAFSSDTFWQAELEASFPYVETDAQARALEEIKADMEQPRPMDRLVCGDVGYGKTEVALRAAFKAVMDGKQVAILVPTTVLAQQHHQTFVERLKAFPVTVEMLSRFLTRNKQKQVVERVAEGGVDVLIGTHRLLSEDVTFKDLGLLIIDEEQRFGVAHKERLKQLRQQVDVLTLTATPIPRTLYMSLTSVRDMSTIDTPPEERLPVRTHVGEADDMLVRQAILRELDRGGQVYFVHNRVMGIYQTAQKLRKLVPEAKMIVAHGQMAERELEKAMLEFAAGKVDVLVCTSIIESGLDIPNANTLIVNRADQFGLAQLYQLKGRVGRGARRAYAYFLHPKTGALTDTARQRLETIAEATELGAGFRIAMRDLEIRGAGELLGARQHGHIAIVGFDLYTRLLAQAIQEARAERETDHGAEFGAAAAALVQPLEQAVRINLPLEAYLAESYVSDSRLRLQLYRRLSAVTTHDAIEEMQAELQDRFGPMPAEAESLFFQLRLKLDALAADVEAITIEEGQIVVRAESLERLDRGWLQRRLGDRARVARRAVWLPLDGDALAPSSDGGDRWRTTLTAVLQLMAEGLAHG